MLETSGVVSAMRLGLTLVPSTTVSENTFSVLKDVFSEHWRSVHHAHKTQLVQLREVTHTGLNEWKEKVLRRFHTEMCCLQLFHSESGSLKKLLVLSVGEHI